MANMESVARAHISTSVQYELACLPVAPVTRTMDFAMVDMLASYGRSVLHRQYLHFNNTSNASVIMQHSGSHVTLRMQTLH